MTAGAAPVRVAAPPPQHQALHAGWEQWLAANLASGFASDLLVARMVARGIDRDVAEAAVAAIKASPIHAALCAAEARARKLERLLDTLGALRALAPPDIARLAPADTDAFRAAVIANMPVVVAGLAREWPAFSRWDFAYLKAVLGDTDVEITADRAADPRFEDNFRAHRRRKAFDRFIDEDVLGTAGNNAYLVSKNRLLAHPRAAPLIADIDVPRALLSADALPEQASLWIGPSGTLTPLHHDACNILFVQVRGRKRVWLIAPCYLPRLYNDRTCFTDFDPESPDDVRFPLARGVPVQCVDLQAGDALLLPVGWWHRVVSLDPSISLSFSTFDLPRRAHVWQWRQEES